MNTFIDSPKCVKEEGKCMYVNYLLINKQILVCKVLNYYSLKL